MKNNKPKCNAVSSACMAKDKSGTREKVRTISNYTVHMQIATVRVQRNTLFSLLG